MIYTLEQIAMQRAAEISLYFDHVRPNGTTCFSAFDGYGFTNYGENIALGQTSAAAVFNSWCETNEKYDGQGHRRNMLDEGFNAIGIAHVKRNGIDFWVQEFGYSSNVNTTKTSEVNGSKAVNLEIHKDLLGGITLKPSVASVFLKEGGSVTTPQITAQMSLPYSWAGDLTGTIKPTWTSDNTSVVAVNGNQFTGLKKGNTTVKAVLVGKTVSLPAYVGSQSITATSISNFQDLKFTGNAVKQNMVLKVGNAQLTNGVDYTTSYQNNVKVGMATVTISGKGYFSGSITKNFRVQFTDVTDKTQFYYDPIYWAVDKNITTGWADGSFRPMNTCNRAAVVTFLWRMEGKPEPTAKAKFKDMTGNAEFDKAISWAASKGITTGWSDNTFRPWDTCKRLAIVSFLYRY